MKKRNFIIISISILFILLFCGIVINIINVNNDENEIMNNSSTNENVNNSANNNLDNSVNVDNGTNNIVNGNIEDINNINNTEKIEQNEQEESGEISPIINPLVTFIDLSFVKEVNRSAIKFYDGKYIHADDVLYDLEGNILLDLSSYGLIEYVNGYLIVEKDNKYGVLGKDFNMLFPVEYYDIEIMSEDCFLLQKLNKNGTYITTVYNPLNKKEYGPYVGVNYYTSKAIIVNKYLGNNLDDISGFMDSNKFEKYLLNVRNDILEKRELFEDYSFSLANKFQEHYLIASKFVDFKGFREGVIDYKGNEIIEFDYDSITNIGDRFLLLEKENSYKLITIDGKTIIELDKTLAITHDIYLEHDILVVEKDNNETEYYDSLGNLIYKTTNDYSFIDYVGDNKYILDASDKCIYIDLSNNTTKIEEIDYSYCSEFLGRSEKGYIIKDSENGKALYNNKLEKVFNNEYDYISLYDNYCMVEENNNYKILSYSEELLLDKEFKDYTLVSDTEIILIDSEYNKYYLKY